jgi:hypothetical protein
MDDPRKNTDKDDKQPPTTTSPNMKNMELSMKDLYEAMGDITDLKKHMKQVIQTIQNERRKKTTCCIQNKSSEYHERHATHHSTTT